ncbi:hypothetical protein A4A49_35848 [Nicotiana attenuata]|uniref:Uncharacterized protein n=1 Tax=Nicotiana attenuata TaxID=49451 RepID=A0A1J6JB06_NICAT|nr:hypothetical protein A4A49_35848 [Nicotiana attenuata]
MKAMYGKLGVDPVIQAAVIQALLSLLFALEFWKTKMNNSDANGVINGASNGNSVELGSISDLEGNNTSIAPVRNNNTNNGLAFRPLIKAVSIKLAKNPNSYACFLGLVWAL